MLIGFKQRFVEPILNGTKTHTIRRERRDGQRARVGETLHLYTGLRTKQCQRIGKVRCTGAKTITIREDGVSIIFTALAPDELEAFAQRDGFQSWEHFMRYWRKEGPLPFYGVITFWDHSTLVR